MTKRAFLQSWLLLTAQPYASYLFHDKSGARARTQQELWEEIFTSESGEAWQLSIRWWIAHEDHFPLVSEMRIHVRRFTAPEAPHPDRTQLVDGAAIPVAQEDILAYAIAHQITVFEAVKRWQDVEAWQRNRAASSHAHQDSEQELR